MSEEPYSNPPAFHSDEFPPSSPEHAAFHIIPTPWEASVSYGGGARNGPNAVLAASVQLEAYLDGNIPGEVGIHTTPPVNCQGIASDIIDRIRFATAHSLALNKLPILLGGEHSMTLGPVQAIRDLQIPFGVVQFDAHADLRETYQGNPLSHACVMKRILDLDIPIFQIGVRSLAKEEVDIRTERSIPYLDAEEIARSGFPETILPDDFPKNLFVSFDVDVFDPSLIPDTGTPEPGGLDWYQAIEGLENALRGRKVFGADFVELSPRPGRHASDFVIAKLVYKFMDLLQKQNAL